MTIWNYKNISADINLVINAKFSACPSHFQKPYCPFCPESLLASDTDFRPLPALWEKNLKSDNTYNARLELLVCRKCGWWYLARFMDWDGSGNVPEFEMFGVAACVLPLRKGDIGTPLKETRIQLAKDFNRTKTRLNPHDFENIVTSVLSDFGYQAKACGRTGDGGIDIILNSPENEVVGVQVKRWKNSVSVSQLRELVGALVLKDMRHGLFVTTSDFQAGCYPLTQEAKMQGYSIDLTNGNEFFEALSFVERSVLPNAREIIKFIEPKQLSGIYSDRRDIGVPAPMDFD